MIYRSVGLAVLLAGMAAPLGAAPSDRPAVAPAGTAETRYCMRLAAATGSLIEPVRCWTRAQWEAQGVDVDKDWPREGIRVID